MAPCSILGVCLLFCLSSPTVPTQEANRFNSTSIRNLLVSSFREGYKRVEESFSVGQRQTSPSAPAPVFTFPRQPAAETLEVCRAGEVFQATVRALRRRRSRSSWGPGQEPAELLTWEDVELISELSRCPPAMQPAVCQHSHVTKYRTVTGVCNNRQNPLWGASNTALLRWLPAEYEDGRTEPKGWNHGRLYNGFPLPPPREVSQNIMKSPLKRSEDTYTQMLVEWGQYIDHDISFTPQGGGKTSGWLGGDCSSSCENIHPCFPIQTGNVRRVTPSCMPFHRSLPACSLDFTSGISQALQRQQINSVTSFIDASSVYGHTPGTERSLRDLSGRNGKLAVNQQFRDPGGRHYLPFIPDPPSACPQDPRGARVECFAAGDSRVNEGLPLIVLHTLWMREHNRVAEALGCLNGHWSADTVYQEARKIVGALHQIINMRDYVPKIVGPEAFRAHVGPYGGYDPEANPSVANVFSTAAFRFGHATISPLVRRLNASFQDHRRLPHLRLHQSFFSPWRLVKEGGIEPVLRGIIGSPAVTFSANMLLTEEVTEKLVVLKVHRHLDLASLNLQRGRDHGLPGYNEWRAFCGLPRLRTSGEFAEAVGDAGVAQKILRLYKHPDNIDLWLGGLVEKVLPGARTGPLFACLIGKQMKALRDGDRFWWRAEGIFSQWQRAELLKASLSKIICDNSHIGEVPKDAFRSGRYPSDYVPCDSIPGINLEAWREEKHRDLSGCGSPGQINSGDYILSSASGKLVALYTCYHGFKLKGAAAIVCEEGRWSGRPPQCSA